MRKHNIGDKISLKGTLIRGVVYDYFEQEDTLYYVHTEKGDVVWFQSDVSELIWELVLQWSEFIYGEILREWKICLGVFLVGVLVGIII